MASDIKGIGNRIKYFRNEKNLSQEKLAEKTGTNFRHISNIENGNKAPSLDLLIDIANALEVSADDLLQDSLAHGKSNADTKVHDLLLDCSDEEKSILTRTLAFLKALLSEFGV